MNCPNCGAVIKEGKFCNYCGAKLPDDTKRVEVNINKRIEDVAEVMRANYETEESKLRQKQMKKELRGSKIKWIICGILFLIGIILLLTNRYISIPGVMLTVGVPAFIVGDWLHKL